MDIMMKLKIGMNHGVDIALFDGATGHGVERRAQIINMLRGFHIHRGDREAWAELRLPSPSQREMA